MPVPLHTHSSYSLLEGVAGPEALLQRAAACGYSSLALTDTNNLYGAVAFAERAADYGIRPLLGACLRQQRSRCVALIADPNGYRSLCRVLSRLHLLTPQEQSKDARLAYLLCENADGLHILADDWVMAEQLRDAFGPRLWLEVVRPRGPNPRAGRSARQEEELLTYGRKLGLQPVASSAAHFAVPEEYATFRLVTAVRQGILLEQLPAQLPITPAHHLVDMPTLRQRFRDLPEAVRNTDILAEQLRADVLPHNLVLPPPHVPRPLEAVGYLRALCERGLRRRDLGGCLAARQRLREEQAVIEAGDMAGYFLVVRDIARYARRRGHPMALRGSAGNSLVCYLLEITDVDPLRFQLPMERFLHPGRVDLPDIDLDFDWKVRDDVLAYVFRRHGRRYTAMISTHQFLQPRSAFRAAGKIHGLSDGQISELDGHAHAHEGQPVGLGLDPRVATRGRPKNFPLEPERWPRLLADARALLGRPHHLSIHPGGVVITPRPIEDYVPLQPAPKGVVITQFEKDAIERIGLVKIDLLGNRALATLEEARHAPRGTQHEVPLHTPQAVLRLLQNGDTLGVNQLESPALRHLLIQMQPASVDDVIQSLALIRPGAASIGAKETFIRRRRGLEPVRHAHPCLEPVLRETLGLMLYEDDALRVLQTLTGLPAPDADRLRKRIAKHRTEEEARRLTVEFLAACDRRGVARTVAGALWVQLAKFNRYSFCKSHAVSYGLIAWQAVTLKAERPLAFWTAALNNNQGMYPRRVYVEAIKRAGIELRLPCVNRSAETFRVEDDAIRTGLGAIGALDEELSTRIIAERQQGKYLDLADFRRRVAPGPEALALLIRCGALDGLGKTRPALFLEADLKDKDEGRAQGGLLIPLSFVPGPIDGWQPANYSAQRLVLEEWQVLGFVVGPPLLSLFREWLPAEVVRSCELAKHVGRRVRVAGLVATARHVQTESGRDMQFVTLEDETGFIEVTLFPGSCAPMPHLTLGPYVATGVVEEQYGVVTLTAGRFELAREAEAASAP